ncbi:hypothetical protein CORC01_09818 [Colletotrichum orchidophilum]|uniref:Receptor L-domain domain-containing protein n=1 Tax=Colletotrichum orchidophilum TaxID=1209926 RepID=A0A1G4B0E9_9PEZI|nr:uncharacterized protein CORC01_09818 [Colletotrichum orchidophilum]OHE94899.1 hypothetical protein CORC01_09818 [Colletotrichum orchidophilum]
MQPTEVIGQECGSFSIKSLADAEALRSCPEIYGDVIIYPKLPSPAFDLEGVKIIHGNLLLNTDCPDLEDWRTCNGYDPITSISSGTLKEVRGRVYFSYHEWLTNISFPESTSVNDMFAIEKLDGLKCLDIDRLKSVAYMRLYASKLATLKLGAFGNVTGLNSYGGTVVKEISIGTNSLESLDGFFQEPELSLDQVTINNANQVKRLQIGVAKIDSLNLDWLSPGPTSNFTLVLGGSGITEMTIGHIETLQSLNGIERLPSLEKLSVGSYTSSGGNYY